MRQSGVAAFTGGFHSYRRAAASARDHRNSDTEPRPSGSGQTRPTHTFCFRYLCAPFADIFRNAHPGSNFMNITINL